MNQLHWGVFNGSTILKNNVELITVDVFDTLLLRNGRSAKGRMYLGERQFSQYLKKNGYDVEPKSLVYARKLAEEIAYRALDVGGSVGEVSFIDLTERQLSILGLPLNLAQARLEIEVGVEKKSLYKNQKLADFLKRKNELGVRVVAVSDTPLPGFVIKELIDFIVGKNCIDKVYSSADRSKSKRRGDVFDEVLFEENVNPENLIHIGDDLVADHLSPSKRGISSIRVPRSVWFRIRRKIDASYISVGDFIHLSGYLWRGVEKKLNNQYDLGCNVLGAIVGEFCFRIWLYVQEASKNNETVVLFCARGGVGIRCVFEKFISHLGLPCNVRRANLLISRLVAARAAVVTRSDSALDELSHEFKGATYQDVASALGGKKYELTKEWSDSFDPKNFYDLLDSESGSEVLKDIFEQNNLFTTHLMELVGSAKRIILCDTGLYASTQKMLSAGFPELLFETIQFARANYKGLDDKHFSTVTGLIVESDYYKPWVLPSVVLRYWHIIESIFEPAVPSVRFFSKNDVGDVVSNSGDLDYGVFDPAVQNDLLAGILAYFERINSGRSLIFDAGIAWRSFRRMIIFPMIHDVDLLDAGVRSRDFGRLDFVNVYNHFNEVGFGARILLLRNNLWREGAIVRYFGRLGVFLLRFYESLYLLRAIKYALSRKVVR